MVGGDAGSSYMRMVLILAWVVELGSSRQREVSIRPGKVIAMRLLRFGGIFMIAKGLLLQGVLKSSRSWKIHDREDFCPIFGGKTFRDHGAGRGCWTGSTPVDGLVMNHGIH